MNLEIGPHWELTGVHGGGTRAVVMGRRGAVGTAHWLASLEGMRILQDGGNAFDAAVTAAAVVSIAEPYMSGIGGVGGAVCHHGPSGSCVALDFHGFAPAAASPERWRQQEDLLDGLGGALVPGVVAGWGALLERYGTIDLERALGPAIEHARRGVAVSILCARHIATSAERLRQTEAGAAVFAPGGRPPHAGEVLVQEDLARTLETIAREGPRSFYEGEIGAAIAAACADGRGLITRDDLAACDALWLEPAHCPYRGREVHTLPPPFASVQLLETLRILEGWELRALGHHSAEHLHLVIEAVKLARADRLRFRLDEAAADWASLLAEDHVAERRAALDPRAAALSPGDWYSSEALAAAELGPRHTTHLVIADAEGSLVSLTATLGYLFGGAVVAGDTGVLVNDMCFFFDLDPASPNVIGPRKRQGSPIAPVAVLGGDGAPWAALGTPGGYGILQTTGQMLSNVVDFDMNPQAALESPRIRVDEGRYVAVESRVPEATLRALAELGHEYELAGPWMYEPPPGRADIGRGSMIVRDGASGMLCAGADPRGDGFALAV